jgi:hypothetical protein
MSRRNYTVTILAEDGRHVKRFASLATARAYAERQFGGTLENRYDFTYNDGGPGFKALDLAALDAQAIFGLSMIDDYGRRITISKAAA